MPEEGMQSEKHTLAELSLTRQKFRASSRVPLLLFARGTALIVLLIFAYYAWIWRNLAVFRLAIDSCSESFCDFANYYYPMGEAIFRTGLPIEGFVYSPFIATLLAVFPPLGFDASLLLWCILQAAFIILYFLCFRWLVPANLTVQLLFVALTLASFPILHNLAWGQVGIFTTVSILGALVLYERGHRAAAATLLAFGISFKFFPVIFLAPFAIRRDIRFLFLTAGACVIFLFVVPDILLGFGDTLCFYTALFESYRHFDWVIGNYNSQYFPNVIARLIGAAGPDARGYLVRLAESVGRNIYDYRPLLRWIGYTVTAASLGLIFLIQRAQLRLANLYSFHILFLSIPFVFPTSWPVDLVYIPFGQALLTWQLLEGGSAARENSAGGKFFHEDAWRIWKSPRRVIAVILLLISIVTSNIVFFNLYDDHLHYGSYGFIFWSDLFLLIATYMELLPSALHQIRAKTWNQTLSSSAMSEASVSR
jgi:hypothetical protein